jgi:sucrose phosphorylase
VGRDINRHFYDEAEIASDCARPVVRRLIELIKLRNRHPAFCGEFRVEPSGDDELHLRWQQQGEWAALRVNFRDRSHELSCSGEGGDGGTRETFAFS